MSFQKFHAQVLQASERARRVAIERIEGVVKSQAFKEAYQRHLAGSEVSAQQDEDAFNQAERECGISNPGWVIHTAELAAVKRGLGAFAPLYYSTVNGERPESDWDVGVQAIQDWELQKQNNPDHTP